MSILQYFSRARCQKSDAKEGCYLRLRCYVERSEDNPYFVCIPTLNLPADEIVGCGHYMSQETDICPRSRPRPRQPPPGRPRGSRSPR